MPNTNEMSIKPVRAARITDTTGALLGESRGRRRPRNTVKNDSFEHLLTILRKIHINLSTGFGRGSGGGRAEVDRGYTGGPTLLAVKQEQGNQED